MKETFTRAEVAEILDFVATEIACMPGHKSGSDPLTQYAERFADGEHDGDWIPNPEVNS